MIRILAVVLLAFPLAVSADELRVLGGKSVSGKTTSITDKEIKIQTPTGEVATPINVALALDFRTAKGITGDTKFTDVRLIDDTVLHCKEVKFLGKTKIGKDDVEAVELTLLSDAKFTVPLDLIVSFLRDANDSELERQWDKITRAKVKTDRIAMLKTMGEKKTLDAQDVILGAVDAKKNTINFTLSEVTVPARLDLVHGLYFFRANKPAEEPVCKVIDIQGNALAAVKISLDKTGDFKLTTTFGAEVNLKGEAVARIDFNLGKLSFLSDLDPSKLIEKSRLGAAEPLRKDVNLDGQPIVLDRAYPKGLSMHAYTEVEYELNGKFKEFKAVLGVDTRLGTNSQAKVSIYLDGAMKFSEVASPKVKNITLDVKDVTTLKIVVSSPDFFGLGDHLTLADAQVSK